MNLLGIDFEDWFHPELIKKHLKQESFQPKIVDGIDKILDWLRKNETFATFFVVGELLEFKPELLDKIIESGEESGDRAWQLPLWDEHQSCTKTKYADLANIGGGREAGTIHAAAFLSKFTNDYKWAHIDIAATASYSTPVKAGTGRPVPLISQLLLSKKLK